MSACSTVEDGGTPEGSLCWCCGKNKQESQLLHLGSRPEAAVCLDCAMHLRRRAREQEAANPVLRMLHAGGRRVRETVMASGVHKRPVIGPVLRWVNRRLPY
ncbi:MAG TPA: hypothetical protein VHV82_12035 [Sporichthyaceae bacterium]|jgi:hypothetical protein|nr:hypothetical protein [Sporichthyaceae bacterium]